MNNLPTVEECREFLDTINVGRVAIGLAPLEKLDYDVCKPGSATNCLSAHHLFWSAGYWTWAEVTSPRGIQHDARLADALSMQWIRTPRAKGYEIPDAIKRVTDVFDRVEGTPDLNEALRERMVEAGVV